MSIKFEKIRIRNFLSFGNKVTEYEFGNGKITNVKGINLDTDSGNDNGSSNGAGKSTIFQAVVYAIYGQGVSDSSKQDEFINLTNGKGMMVELHMTVNDKPFVVTRCRKPNSCTLNVDGEDLTRDSLANTSKLIVDMLGMSREVFVVSFMMTTAVKPLFDRKGAEQRDFMENLLGMDRLSERAETAKKIRDDLQVDIRLLEKDVESADAINEREQRRIDDSKARFKSFEERRTETMSRLETAIDKGKDLLSNRESIIEAFNIRDSARKAYDEASNRLKENERSVSDLRLKLAGYEKKRSEIQTDVEYLAKQKKQTELSLKKVSDVVENNKKEVDEMKPLIDRIEAFLDLEEQFTENCDKQDDLALKIKGLDGKIEDLDAEITELEKNKCPYCEQEWHDQGLKSKLDNKLDQKKSLNSDKDTIKDQMSGLVSALQELEKKISDLDVDIDSVDDHVSRWDEINENAKTFKRDRDKLESELRDIEAKYEDAKESVNEIEKIDEFIDGISKDIDIGVISMKDDELAFEARRKELNEAQKDVHPDFDQLIDFKEAISKFEAHEKEYDRVKNEENPHKDIADPEFVDIDAIQKELKEKEDRLKHTKYLIKLLTDSKSFIRRNIIGRYVPYLNKMVNTYADKLDSPHICEIDNDLSVNIEYMRKSVSFGSLSAGEKLKVSVSLAIALRDLMSTFGVQSDFLMVDELFDSALDIQSKKKVFKLIRDKFDTVMLVSHSGEFDDKCDNSIFVKKENGFSRLT